MDDSRDVYRNRLFRFTLVTYQLADIYLRWDVDYTHRFTEEASDVHLKWIEEPIPDAIPR